ncbi:MAG: family 10 glycosylhydrolase [Akkermansia sp.]|nr:family 10 glycosylhydrolase [Akkermansia sp.]MCD8071160.1 family 10 glycosylhydrolase [Akkermansiaceae bacterium]
MKCIIRLIVTFVLVFAWIPRAFAWRAVSESVPPPPQEFRAAWVASVFNLDWPKRAGESAGAQKAELIDILNKAARLKLNAVILQIRPNGDALYRSPYEPWSQWLSGAGVNPGYDPLAFAVSEAHRRGIELHAWFNPFRAKANSSPVGRGHVSLRYPELMKKAGGTLVLNPSHPAAQEHVLKVIMDVVKRYDIDGVHLDDYFYPYPPHHNIRDGKTPAQRRAAIDAFVSRLYSSVKGAKPWVRVGISPFGIWQPGFPAGIEAGVNACEHLACDARKWLSKGWVDYLAPQLYWSCSPARQSFPALMKWWSDVNPSRPVWPGISTARIQSREDPSRTAAEISRQIGYSRSLARSSSGQLFWSWTSLGGNRGGVQGELARCYSSAAVPPAMPWCGRGAPGAPALQAAETSRGVYFKWTPADRTARKWVVQARTHGRWTALCILPGAQTSVTLPRGFLGAADRVAVRGVSACGNPGGAAAVAR